MTTRRSFLGSILAMGAAPVIVRADALMRIVPTSTLVLNAGDVTWTAVDFDHDTIKAMLVYSDHGLGDDRTAVTRILYGRDLRLVNCDLRSTIIITDAAPRLLFES